MMRALSLVFVFSASALLPSSLLAGDASPHRCPIVTVKPVIGDANPNRETYRGYYSDLSAVADRKDFPELAVGLRHQIDIVENSELSPRVLQFFQTIPIVVDDFACVGNMREPASGDPKPIMASACYNRNVPENMRDKHGFDPVTRAKAQGTGTMMVRPTTLVDQNRERPVLLHELFHAYHDHILPDGFANPAALSWFKQATDKHLYPADQYLMTNGKEFFAVTTSVFLLGKDGLLDRAKIREVQPDYYKYLVWLFEFDPDRASGVSPVALAAPQDILGSASSSPTAPALKLVEQQQARAQSAPVQSAPR
jgi:hypothetical protein